MCIILSKQWVEARKNLYVSYYYFCDGDFFTQNIHDFFLFSSLISGLIPPLTKLDTTERAIIFNTNLNFKSGYKLWPIDVVSVIWPFVDSNLCLSVTKKRVSSWMIALELIDIDQIAHARWVSYFGLFDCHWSSSWRQAMSKVGLISTRFKPIIMYLNNSLLVKTFSNTQKKVNLLFKC